MSTVLGYWLHHLVRKELIICVIEAHCHLRLGTCSIIMMDYGGNLLGTSREFASKFKYFDMCRKKSRDGSMIRELALAAKI